MTRRSGKFWLVVAVFLIATIVLWVPLHTSQPYPVELVFAVVGAIAGAVIRDRDPVVADALTVGMVAWLAAFAVLILVAIPNLRFP